MSDTNVFRITYGSGLVEEVTTDAVDVADQINRTFGLTVEEAEEHGVKVELLDRPLAHIAAAEDQAKDEALTDPNSELAKEQQRQEEQANQAGDTDTQEVKTTDGGEMPNL